MFRDGDENYKSFTSLSLYFFLKTFHYWINGYFLVKRVKYDEIYPNNSHITNLTRFLI